MRLTIIAPDNVYEHEVDPSMEVQDVQALVEAEVSVGLSYLQCRSHGTVVDLGGELELCRTNAQFSRNVEADAQTGLPAASFHVSNDSGVALTESSRSLESYGMKGEMATVFLTIKSVACPQPIFLNRNPN